MNARLKTVHRFASLLSLFCVITGGGLARAQFGAIFSGTGAVNRSMAGASTAAPLSPAGAIYWNPATISGLQRSELEFGAELLFADTQVASRFNAGSFGPGAPPVSLSGSTRSDSGVYALPTIALAYLPEDSRLSYGLGLYAVAGFGTDYAGSATNPILGPRPPVGLGVGPIYSEFSVFQIHPTVSYRLTDRLSIGGGPTLNLATLKLDPFLLAPPDDANGDGFFTYPQGNHSETTWGGGFDFGMYYQADIWAVGASIKSPQWFDAFRYNSADELGRPRRLTFNLDLPMIASVGGAYTGLERWLFALDVRFLDYQNANGAGDRGIAPDGALRGAGWRSIFAVATGAQYQLNNALSLRMGYSWNENQVPDGQSAVNIVAPVLVEHTLSAGATWKVTSDFSLSLTYLHAFENSIEGPVLTAAGPVPGTSVRNSVSADSVVIGGSVQFGGPRKCEAQASTTQIGPSTW